MPSRAQLRGSKTSLLHSAQASKNAGVVPLLIPTDDAGASVTSIGLNIGGTSGGCEVRAVVGPEAEVESTLLSGLVGSWTAAKHAISLVVPVKGRSDPYLLALHSLHS